MAEWSLCSVTVFHCWVDFKTYSPGTEVFYWQGRLKTFWVFTVIVIVGISCLVYKIET